MRILYVIGGASLLAFLVFAGIDWLWDKLDHKW